MTDYLRTIKDHGWAMIAFPGALPKHSSTLHRASIAACPRDRREVAHHGLNESSPLRQGSGQFGGSWWGWHIALSHSETEANLKRRQAVVDDVGSCPCCERPFLSLSLMADGLPKLKSNPWPQLPGVYVCRSCNEFHVSYRATMPFDTMETAEIRSERRKHMDSCIRGQKLKSGPAECLRCHIKTKEAKGGNWERAELVVPLLHDLKGKLFCRSCYGTAQSIKTINISGPDEFATAEGQRAWVAKGSKKQEMAQRSCIKCRTTETARNQWCTAGPAVPALDDLKGRYFCTACRQSARRRGNLLGAKWTASEQRTWFNEPLDKRRKGPAITVRKSQKK